MVFLNSLTAKINKKEKKWKFVNKHIQKEEINKML